ncbi:mRNA capping enzyme [Rhizoctonia solani]|uniref:mRNA cap guanine-N(7) methyltransferase n=1 Tax=Rhizoctonia solani TaxID=456999 RepID=A0A8H7IJB5_9AGAM|nr:mRNA capping enzyme [Rhizoctonia solani]
MLLNDGPPHQAPAHSIHTPSALANRQPPSSSGGLQFETASSPAGQPWAPLHCHTAPPLLPAPCIRSSTHKPGTQCASATYSDEQAAMDRSCRNTLRTDPIQSPRSRPGSSAAPKENVGEGVTTSQRPLQESNTHGSNPQRSGYNKRHCRSIHFPSSQSSYGARPNQRFDAEFHAFDCLAAVVSPGRLRTPFDVVSMQFCMHYAFESLQKVRTMLENVSDYLRPGGIFLGTIPIRTCFCILNQLPGDETSFGNSVYSIRFDSKQEQPLYGHRYWFYLKDAVEDVPEYVVRWEEFEALSLEYGLKPIYRSEFHDVVCAENGETRVWPVCTNDEGRELAWGHEMTDDQWQAANIYIAFAFEKQ